MVFLHGLGGNRHAFDRQLAALGEHFRCVAWDAPGYGGSEPITEMTFSSLARCLNNLLEHLDEKPYALVGHSIGGMIMQTWLHSGGIDRVEKVVLAQTSARFGKSGSDFNREFLAGRLAPIEAGQAPGDFARDLIRSMFVDQTRIDDIETAVATMAPLPAATYRQVIECLVTFDEYDALADLSIPALCLAAAGDKTAPAKVMQQMCDAMSDGQFHCIPEAGHLAYLEDSEGFNAALQAFLTGEPD